jgi:uncharacterized protein YdaU (DUF1376 family)
MTWPKFGVEFPDECAEAELSSDAFRTHVEAIIYIYRVESFDCAVRKSRLRRWAASALAEQAAAELVAKGFWRDDGPQWTVLHHRGVIQSSLVTQRKKRETSKKTSATHRAKQKVSAEVTRHVTPNPDRQTDIQTPGREESSRQADGRVFDGPWGAA